MCERNPPRWRCEHASARQDFDFSHTIRVKFRRTFTALIDGRRNQGPITSLVGVSFYDSPLVRPVFPHCAACPEDLEGRSPPAAVNDQKILAICEEEDDEEEDWKSTIHD